MMYEDRNGMTAYGREVHYLYAEKWMHGDRVLLDPACGVNNNRGGSWIVTKNPVTCDRCLKVLAERA
jgi:hypothetical protein